MFLHIQSRRIRDFNCDQRLPHWVQRVKPSREHLQDVSWTPQGPANADEARLSKFGQDPCTSLVPFLPPPRHLKVLYLDASRWRHRVAIFQAHDVKFCSPRFRQCYKERGSDPACLLSDPRDTSIFKQALDSATHIAHAWHSMMSCRPCVSALLFISSGKSSADTYSRGLDSDSRIHGTLDASASAWFIATLVHLFPDNFARLTHD